ncbi:unnamed protein product [Rodentolepis nana]|uniref:Receptor L-domain domain-containing protein n=1 Tax=Rodentolepis nana TaxID=102285 RepID=A0A0R3T1A3_RODNA|nr:unnamed protein product [Rodentolepis nana]
MYSRRNFTVSFLILVCLIISRLSAIESDWGTFCQIEEKERAICYLNCFEDIFHLPFKNLDLLLISGLVVFQNSDKCDRNLGVETFEQFKNLKEFYYTGAICPFSKLPNISNLNRMQIQIDMKGKVPSELGTYETTNQTILPNIKKLAISRICCDLFGRNFIAPQLEDLKFHCLRKRAFITGVERSYGDLLHFTAPRLKRLDFIEDGLGFPVSYVGNLPELNFLSIIKNSKLSKIPPPEPISNHLNLSSLREIIYSDPNEPNLLQCLELGDVNLTRIYFAYPIPTCSSAWRCPSCHPNGTNDSQNVTIVAKSKINTKMSHFLPNITLNTTSLVFEHSPLLIIDSEAMSRFSHLRIFQVKTTESENGKAILLGNPFKTLQRPMELQFLRLSLLECDCLEYSSLSWLKTQNALIEGEIECPRLETNKWFKIADFLNAMTNSCSYITSEDILSDLNLQRIARLKVNDSGNLARPSLIMGLIYFLFKLF